jgi:hypothetical protein
MRSPSSGAYAISGSHSGASRRRRFGHRENVFERKHAPHLDSGVDTGSREENTPKLRVVVSFASRSVVQRRELHQKLQLGVFTRGCSDAQMPQSSRVVRRLANITSRTNFLTPTKARAYWRGALAPYTQMFCCVPGRAFHETCTSSHNNLRIDANGRSFAPSPGWRNARASCIKQVSRFLVSRFQEFLVLFEEE